MTLFGFEGSSVDRTEPTGYQFAAQSKEGEGRVEAAAFAAARGVAREEEEEEEEEVSGREGGRGADDDDDAATCRRRRRCGWKKAGPFPAAAVGLTAAFGGPRPAAAPAEHGEALSIGERLERRGETQVS